MRDPRLNIEIKSMEMSAEARLRSHPGARRRESSVKVLLFKLGVMILIAVAFFWWVSS